MTTGTARPPLCNFCHHAHGAAQAIDPQHPPKSCPDCPACQGRHAVISTEVSHRAAGDFAVMACSCGASFTGGGHSSPAEAVASAQRAWMYHVES